ncbi:hypothetical protein G6F68_021018 [Rhizopus microsporus]|nr:hypothetical protein G6F68_021018 [Rhizopus microsporus]
MGKVIYEHALRHEDIDPAKFLSEADKVLLKRRVFALKRSTLPPIVTHNIIEDHKDPVLSQLRGISSRVFEC